MKKLNNYLIIIMFLFLSCNDEIELNKTLLFKEKGLAISVRLNKMHYKKFDEKVYTYIHGEIEIHNYSKSTLPFDLNEVHLSVNGKLGTIDIDSIASILILEEQLLPDTLITRSVYWGFGAKFDENKLNTIEIHYIKNGPNMSDNSIK